jgi:hypothetical protein
MLWGAWMKRVTGARETGSAWETATAFVMSYTLECFVTKVPSPLSPYIVFRDNGDRNQGRVCDPYGLRGSGHSLLLFSDFSFSLRKTLFGFFLVLVGFGVFSRE